MSNSNKWFGYALIAVIVLVWAAAYVTTFFDHSYQPPAGITEVMMAVIGFVLTGSFIFGQKNNDNKPPDPP